MGNMHINGGGGQLTADQLAGIQNSAIGEINPAASLSDLAEFIPIFSTVADMEAGWDPQVVYCAQTATFYREEENGGNLTVDHQYICSGFGGPNRRWVGIAGQYVYAG